MKCRESIKKSLDRIEEFKKYKLNEENIELIYNYVTNHGTCEFGMLEYARILNKQGNYEDAKSYFELLLYTKNRKFALVELILLEFRLKNYLNCLTYLRQLHDEDLDFYNKEEFYNVQIYCSKELGVPIDVDLDQLSYKSMMMINYEEEVALNHIMLHTVDGYKEKNKIKNFDVNKSDEYFFAKSIDVEQLFNDTRMILDSDEKFKYSNNIINYGYIIKIFSYPSIGDNTRGRLNYLKVVTILGTNNIITMLPIESVDSDYLLEDNEVYDYFECLENVKGKAL